MTVLRAPPGSPWWLVAAADTILVLHIAGGSVGIVSGMVALFARKGSRVHRVAGKLFGVAMLVMATIGAAASPFLPVPEMANVVAGVLAIYLVVTGWMAVQRRPGIARFEKGGLAVALGIVAAGALFMLMAKNSPTGTVGKTPPQAFVVFVPVFVPLLLLFFWLVRVRIGKRFKGGVAAPRTPDANLALEP